MQVDAQLGWQQTAQAGKHPRFLSGRVRTDFPQVPEKLKNNPNIRRVEIHPPPTKRPMLHHSAALPHVGGRGRRKWLNGAVRSGA
jgi:hypothetical protein